MLKSEAEVQRLWDIALKSRHKSDLATAINCYQRIRELRPQRIDVCCELGNLYQQLQKPQQAIDAYQNAIDINPIQPSWVYQTLGKILEQQQQYSAAITAYQNALNIEPDESCWVYDRLGNLLDQQGKSDMAIAVYRQLIEKNTSVAADTQVKIGNIYHQQHQYFAAKAAYRQASIARARHNIKEVINFINEFLADLKDIGAIDILDNGCDPTGRQLAILAEQTRGRVVGTNISSGFPQHTVKHRRHNNEFYPMDGQNLSFDDSSFDLVVSLNVLEHVSNPKLYLKECYRVMRRGGYGFFSWYPLWSGATGHHIHPDMVSNQARSLNLKTPEYRLDGTSIPFWGHLLYSADEMLEFLISDRQYSPALAKWMRDYTYYGKDLNRCFWRDLWHSFNALTWKLIKVDYREKHPIDTQTLNKLERKYGFVDNFQICGATIVVKKLI